MLSSLDAWGMVKVIAVVVCVTYIHLWFYYNFVLKK